MGYKALGLSGTCTIAGSTYDIDSVSWKISEEQNPYTPLGATGGWSTQVTGGEKQLTGEFEFAYDSSFTSASGGNPIQPFTDSLVAMTINLVTTSAGSDTLSFNALVHEIGGDKKSKGLHRVKCAYTSSGAVTATYAAGSAAPTT
jgi:hypothetical protein